MSIFCQMQVLTEQFYICGHHFLNQGRKVVFGFSAKFSLRFGWVTDQEVCFGWAEVS